MAARESISRNYHLATGERPCDWPGLVAADLRRRKPNARAGVLAPLLGYSYPTVEHERRRGRRGVCAQNIPQD